MIPDKNDTLRLKLEGLRFFVDLETAALSGNDSQAAALLEEMRRMGKWPAKDVGLQPGLTSWYGGGHWKSNGELRRTIERSDDAELLARHEIQAHPPDVLVTNYSMLEYMMLRPIERSIFSATRQFFTEHREERFILVLDEAHLYRGAQGTEVAMLIRRLKQRLDLRPDQFQVITTSASFGSPEAARTFAAGLTGTDREQFTCLTGTRVVKLPSGAGAQADAAALAAVDLTRLLSDDLRERFEAIRPLSVLDPSVSLECPELTNDGEQARQLLSRRLFDLLGPLSVTGRLLNLTSQSLAEPDAETHHNLGAQEIGELARRLFPEVEVTLARQATDVLIEAASMARSEAGAAPLLAARVHRFFRGIPGVWACSNPDCSELPPELRGQGLTGRLFAQPQRDCGCGSRVFELHACQSCGSPFFLAFTRNPRRPQYLWQEDVGEVDGVDGTVAPIHLWLENPHSLEIETDAPADVRDMDLEPLTGRLMADAGESTTTRPVCLPPKQPPGSRSGLFTVCPRCQGQYSRISDLATKGDEPFQHLLTAQLLSQPPNPNDPTPLQGRKLLVFSDGRQPASRLAGRLKSNSLRDAVRPLLIEGLRYVAERWYDGATARVSLKHAYAALLCGAESRRIALYPQLRSHEQGFDNHVRLIRELVSSTTADRSQFEHESDLLGSKAPQAVLIALYEVLFNPLSGMHSLGLGKLTPLLPPFVQGSLNRLPVPENPPAISDDNERRDSLLEFWMHRMARQRAALLPGTPTEWIGNPEAGARVNLSEGKFQAEMTHRVGTRFYQTQLSGGKQGPGDWRQFYSERLGNGGQGGEFLLQGQYLSLDCDFADWLRCRVCSSVLPASPFLLDRCPECRCRHSLEELTESNPELWRIFETRKGFFRSGLGDHEGSSLRPFVAEEHTAAIGAIDQTDAFSRAEWHEMRFQNLQVTGPGGESGGVVDVLSCTTTMEVGIDIGSLTAVSLRNVPPNRANYQQRAGRAGRRGSSLSTVITYADQGTHDQRYFAHPAEMIAGPVTDPTLNLDNLEIVRRHGFAMILSLFQQDRIPDSGNNAESADLFASLGKVREFRTGDTSGFSLVGLRAWLQEHRECIEQALREIAPGEYLAAAGEQDLLQIPARLLDRLQEIGCGELQVEAVPVSAPAAVVRVSQGFDELFEDEDPLGAAEQTGPAAETPAEVPVETQDVGRQNENVLDLLFDTATLPSYAFPTDVVSLTVFDQGRSSEHRVVIKYGPQRGLDQALSSYAPGREVFIDGYRHYSFALWSPVSRDRLRAWDRRELYFECQRCGYAILEPVSDRRQEGRCLDCPSCGERAGLGPGLYWIVPPGFAHPVDLREDLALEEPPDLSRPTQAKLSAPFNEATVPGETFSFGDRGFTCWSAKESLFLTNRGAEDLQNRGFHYCLRCGRIEPVGWQSARSCLNRGGQHPKPFPNHRGKPNCQGFVRRVSLGTRFVSDVTLYRFALGEGVQLPPGSTLAKLTLTTVAQALAIVAADLLEIDRTNIGAEYRAAQTPRGASGTEVDVYLYDTTPGGAGFVRAAVAAPVALIERALGLLENCTCSGSCYRCLRSFYNRYLHTSLDRFLGASLLKHLLNKEAEPCLPPKKEQQLLRVLAQDLKDSGEAVETRDGFLTLPARNNRRIVLAHALRPGRPGSDRAAAALSQGANNAPPVDHLRVERALPAAVEDCLGVAAPVASPGSQLPAGVVESPAGIPLHTFATLSRGWPAESVTSVAVTPAGMLPEKAFMFQLDGPQLERFSGDINGSRFSLQQGTCLLFEACDEAASKSAHDGKLLLLHSSAETFRATGEPVTLGLCRWQNFDDQTSIRVQYLSTSPRAMVQKVAPETTKVIGKALGIIFQGQFHPVSFT